MSQARRILAAGALGKRSLPDYEVTRSGPLLVVGSAPSARDDVAGAKRLFPGAPLMVLNDAVAHFPGAAFVVSMHYEKLTGWRQIRETQPGTFEVHSTFPTCGQVPNELEAVDYWWTGCHSGATSAWLGVRIARKMGFLPIVLCGCPLEPVGYLGVARPPEPDKERLGHMRETSSILRTYRETMRGYVDAGEGEGVYSMSGWTRKLLGPPPGTDGPSPARASAGIVATPQSAASVEVASAQ